MTATGFPFKSERYTDSPDSIPLVRGDNIVQGAMRWDGVKRWPLAERNEHALYELREGDVVLAMDRPWIEAGLKYAAISKHDLPCLLVQRTARLRGGPKLDTRFLRYLIGSREFTQHIHAITTGTAVPHISGKQIKDFTFTLPPLAEQKAIAAVLGALDDKIELNRRMNATLEAMALRIDLGETGATDQGYATELTPEQLEKQRAAQGKVCADSDVVICTAKLFGRKAPLLVKEDVVASMSHGSIVVDLAAETGGNVEGVVAGEEVVTENGVRLIGHRKLENFVPRDASGMFANNLANFVEHFWDKEAGAFKFDDEDPILKGAVLTRDGKFVNEHPAFKK